MTAWVDNYCNYYQTKSACTKHDADEGTGLKWCWKKFVINTRGKYKNIKISKHQKIWNVNKKSHKEEIQSNGMDN